MLSTRIRKIRRLRGYIIYLLSIRIVRVLLTRTIDLRVIAIILTLLKRRLKK